MHVRGSEIAHLSVIPVLYMVLVVPVPSKSPSPVSPRPNDAVAVPMAAEVRSCLSIVGGNGSDQKPRDGWSVGRV